MNWFGGDLLDSRGESSWSHGFGGPGRKADFFVLTGGSRRKEFGLGVYQFQRFSLLWLIFRGGADFCKARLPWIFFEWLAAPPAAYLHSLTQYLLIRGEVRLHGLLDAVTHWQFQLFFSLLSRSVWLFGGRR